MLNLRSKITDKSQRPLVNLDYFQAIIDYFPRRGRRRRKIERREPGGRCRSTFFKASSLPTAACFVAFHASVKIKKSNAP